MLKYFAGFLFLLVSLQASQAEIFPAPNGKVLLTVSGNITNTNVNDTAQLDMDFIKNLPVHASKTYTSWTEGEVTFEGFLLSDLIKKLGAKGTSIYATAINDYEIEIPFSDAKQYPVLIAYKKEGEYMTVRNKGPLWVIYLERTPGEMRLHNDKMIWQLVKMTFR